MAKRCTSNFGASGIKFGGSSLPWFSLRFPDSEAARRIFFELTFNFRLAQLGFVAGFDQRNLKGSYHVETFAQRHFVRDR
jgi:hypothetical protein